MGSIAVRPLLLDTHVWLWFLFGDDRLPADLRALIAASPDDRWLSPVSVWELGRLVARGRIEVAPDIRTWVIEARATLPLLDAPLTQDVAIRAHEVALPHRDPADRFLAATALSYDLALVTVDERLVSAGWLTTVSG